jgi:hypothetical protein
MCIVFTDDSTKGVGYVPVSNNHPITPVETRPDERKKTQV